jgi:predicted extracellular nuclease
MSSGGRLYQPTYLAEPGPAALALQAQNDLNRIIIDDALNNQNPDPILFGRGGNELTAGQHAARPPKAMLEVSFRAQSAERGIPTP